MKLRNFANKFSIWYNLYEVDMTTGWYDMEFNLATILSLLSIVFVILSFAFNRNDKSSKEIGELSYKQGKTDQLFNDIMEKLEKIEKSLDKYDKEIDERIEKSVNNHIAIYHSKKD